MQGSSGAPPSNTAPANYINTEKTKILRFGVDSLYLFFSGQLASEWDQRLTGLKLAAQSQEETQEAKAQVKLGEHLFEVKGKGGQRFSFVLVDTHSITRTIQRLILCSHATTRPTQ